MVADSWFRGLWKKSRKHEVVSEKVRIGVLAFEVASLMSKIVHLWHSLSDKQVFRMREEIMSSVGIQKLVSDDDDYIVSLICAEMVKNLEDVSRAVTRLSKKCSDPYLKSFEQAYSDLVKIGSDPCEWHYTSKKMDRKVKKMERFIMVNANLHQEAENLSELEQMLRRMKCTDDPDSVNLLQYEKRLIRKQQVVKHLKEISLWNRTYHYTVCLLARSLFTIFSRIGHVFGFNHINIIDVESNDSKTSDSDYIYRSQSVSALLQSSAHPSENRITRFSSGPLGNKSTKSGPISKKNGTTNFYSGPLGNSGTTFSITSGKHKAMNFYSGPLGRSITKSGPQPRASITGRNLWRTRNNSSTLQGNRSHGKPNRLTTVGPFRGCMVGGDGAPVKNCYLNTNGVCSGPLVGFRDAKAEICSHNSSPQSDPKIFSSKGGSLNAPPGTLGAAALALHYANVIIIIEKLVASPHLIGHDARDDLYNMLPANVRAALRARLKPYAKSLALSVYDTVLAREWSDAMLGILEWLAPLAHNMIRLQSERSFEHQNLLSRTNVLLVHTLFYANQEKTEATITELLVGLNYVWRYGRELNAKALLECESGRTFDDSFSLED